MNQTCIYAAKAMSLCLTVKRDRGYQTSEPIGFSGTKSVAGYSVNLIVFFFIFATLKKGHDSG